jgi:hypothetical protein
MYIYLYSFRFKPYNDNDLVMRQYLILPPADVVGKDKFQDRRSAIGNIRL